ncbi:hypothetical protein ABK040_009136 [Willaertia magna]
MNDGMEFDGNTENGTTKEEGNGEVNEITTPKVNRKDFIRLIIQSLHTLKCSKTATLLEEESGINYLSNEMKQFKKNILHGEWDTVCKSIDTYFTIENCKNPKIVKYFILRQKYLELLEEDKVIDALNCLKEEINPILSKLPFFNGSDHLHTLSCLLLIQNIDQLKRTTKWDGRNGNSRKVLLSEIEKYISPSLIIPENQLEKYLIKAIQSQREENEEEDDLNNFNDEEGIPLLTMKNINNLQSSNEVNIRIPNHLICTLENHKDEVWICRFSSNGELLATSGLDKFIYVYKVRHWINVDNEMLDDEKEESNNYEPEYTLTGHTGSISVLRWSPNDKYLLSCCNAMDIKVWNNSQCIYTTNRNAPIVSCCWINEESFLTISEEKNSEIVVWRIYEEGLPIIIDSWKLGTRVIDAELGLNNNSLIIATFDKKVEVIDLKTRKEIFSLLETNYITSLSVNNNGRYLLVNLAISDDEITSNHLWDLKEKKLVKEFSGSKQTKYVIRSCFIGNNLIASGSEDTKIYIWNRNTTELSDTLFGHAGVVNSVSWNKKYNLLASASDDTTVKIWSYSL